MASSSVVSKDAPPYAVVVDDSAEGIRTRIDDETIAALLEIAWRDWDVAEIGRNRTGRRCGGRSEPA